MTKYYAPVNIRPQEGGGGRAREEELDKPDFPVSWNPPPQGHLRLSNSPLPGTHCLSWHQAVGWNICWIPWPLGVHLMSNSRLSSEDGLSNPLIPPPPPGPNIDWCIMWCWTGFLQQNKAEHAFGTPRLLSPLLRSVVDRLQTLQSVYLLKDLFSERVCHRRQTLFANDSLHDKMTDDVNSWTYLSG